MPYIVGIRFQPGDDVVFCHAEQALQQGQRVSVAVDGDTRRGIVAIAPELIIAAPSLPDAPRLLSTESDTAEATRDAVPDGTRLVTDEPGRLADPPVYGRLTGSAGILPVPASDRGPAGSRRSQGDDAGPTARVAQPVLPGRPQDDEAGGVVFLPADDSAIGPADLARALALAELPLPEQPAERR